MSISNESTACLPVQKVGSTADPSWHLIANALGFALVACFTWLTIAQPKVPITETLVSLQQVPVYRAASGSLLLGYIGYQWYLSYLRWRRKHAAAKFHFKIHQQLAWIAPFLFYAHSIRTGFAYLAWLSIGFFANHALGFVSPYGLKIRAASYAKAWLIGHVALSVIIVLLATCHVYFAALYT
jgi:hypothetical protein